MDRGYVRLWRRTLDSDLWQNKNANRLFDFFLMSATRLSRKYSVGSQVLELAPGDYVSSIRKLAVKCGLTVKEIRGALRFLYCTDRVSNRAHQTAQEEAQKRAQPFTVFSVVNWHIYQADQISEGTAEGTPKGTAEGRERAQRGHKNKNKDLNTGANGVRPLLDLYVELFEQKFHQVPVIGFAKDGAILKDLVKALGEDVVRDILRRFFESTDPFVVKSGYSIGVFRVTANRLLAESSRQTTPPAYEGSAGRRLESLV